MRSWAVTRHGSGVFPRRSRTPSNSITTSKATRARTGTFSTSWRPRITCAAAPVGPLSTRNLPLPPDSVYRGLGLDQVALAVIWEELLPTLEKATSLAVT